MSSDAILEAVQHDLAERSARGLSKYGVHLGDAGLTDQALLQHAYEEALDLAMYLKAKLESAEQGEAG